MESVRTVNNFLANPVKVYIVDPRPKKRGINCRHVYVYLGDVPKNIRDAVDKLAENVSGKKISRDVENTLKTYYGNDWRKKLAADRISGEDVEITGGGPDDDVDANAVFTSEYTHEYSNDVATNEYTNDVTGSHDALITIADLADDRPRRNMSGMTGIKGMNLEDIEIDDDQLIVDRKNLPRVTIGEDIALRVSLEPGVTYVNDVWVFPEDKFSELKDKIFVSTGIPNYRQHLFWMHSDRMQIPYRIYADGAYSIDIRAAFADMNHELLGMPIDKNLYVVRDEIKVEALDTFRALCDTLSGEHNVYVVDLDQFIDPNRSQLIDMVNDSYQFDLLYYGFVLKFWPQFTRECFYDYVTNEKELYQKFPDFAKSKTYLRNMQSIEQQIINRNYKLMTKAVEMSRSARSPVNLAVTHMVATTVWEKNIVNLRNLFDKLHVNRCVPEIYAYIDHEGKRYLLRKRFVRNERDIMFPPVFKTGLIIAISMRKADQQSYHRRSSNETPESEQSRYIFLNIRANGRYYIKSIWNEEDEQSFDSILSIMRKTTDPIIDAINTMGKYVFPTDKPLPKMTRNNVIYDNLSISVYWKKILSSGMFKFVKTLFEEYVYGGIVGVKGLQQIGQFELIFRKGMTEFDPGQIERVISMANIETVSNQYSHLSNSTVKQKWDQLYDGRAVKLHHRTTDLKFEVLNIKENEFKTLYSYLLVFIYRAMHNEKLKTFASAPSTNVKKLRKLKEIDPELYNLKKYGSKKVYSKICQNPNQPVVYTEDEIRGMSLADRKSLVKYWNFTLNRDAFYGCPNKKYPHLSFKVGMHPKGYCLPCCKKSESAIDSKKARINEICLKKHIWQESGDAEEDTMLSRHIINYGKEVDVGRLSKLPASSLSSLVAGTLNESRLGYYLYGVPQHYPGLEIAGLIYTIAEGLEMPSAEFVKRCINEISHRGLYSSLMNGALVEYFSTEKDFVSTLTDIFVDMKPIVMSHRFSQWDDLFSELAVLIFNTYVYIFVDENGKGDYTYLYVNERTRQLIIQGTDSDAKYLLAVKKISTTYPVFVINIDTYFKNLRVTRRLFTAGDTVIRHLNTLINVDNTRSTTGKTRGGADLHILREFSSTYKVVHKYINNRNLCYAVLLADSSAQYIYVPVDYSVNITDGTPEVHGVYDAATHPVSTSSLTTFAAKFNEYVSTHQNNYTPIVFRFAAYVDSKLNHLRGEGHTVYYANVEDTPHGLSRQDAKYDFAAINAAIFSRRSPQSDNRMTMLGKSLYDNYLYQLFMLEFINYTEKERNVELRKLIRDVLSKTDFRRKIFEAQRELRVLLKQYTTDSVTIQSQIAWAFHNGDKRGLFDTIDSTVYEFDKMTINRLRKLPLEAMRVELRKIVSEFTTQSPLTESKLLVPNIYLPCEYTTNVEYCKGKRLVMETAMLNSYVDILASDLVNPIKYKYLTSGLFTDNIIDYFKFDQYAGEIITITKM